MRSVIGKFLADRGTHLAAMVAYSALLSLVPLLFLATSVLGLLGEQTASSFLIDQLQRTFPTASVDDLLQVVDELQQQAGLLTAVGVIGLSYLLFGTWMALYGLTHTACRHSLPRWNYYVGLFYLLSGGLCLVTPGVSFLNPWPMGIVFFAGELVGGSVLILDKDDRGYPKSYEE